MRLPLAMLCALVLSVSCAGENGGQEAAPEAPAADEANLGFRPNGDTEIQPDLSGASDELKAIFQHVDDHFDEHVMRLVRWVQQPSISNTGEASRSRPRW